MPPTSCSLRSHENDAKDYLLLNIQTIKDIIVTISDIRIAISNIAGIGSIQKPLPLQNGVKKYVKATQYKNNTNANPSVVSPLFFQVSIFYNKIMYFFYQ